MKYVKISKTTKDIRCPVCKEQMWCDGTGWRQIPIGFGCRNGKFVVDAARYYGYCCECEKHGKYFAWHTVKTITKTPERINKKIQGVK